MNYGKRLQKARMQAKLSQKGLSDKTNNVCTQENISKLERGSATGSEYTVQLALACGVSPYWLATGEGEMVGALEVHNPRIKSMVLLMEQMPDYAVDQVVKDAAATEELVRKARSSNRKR